MELTDLGFDDWFMKNAKALCDPHLSIARVMAVDRDRYMIRNELGDTAAKVPGHLLYSATTSVELPCTGDWVCVNFVDSNSFAMIHTILPRKSFLQRKTAGKEFEYQMIAANIETAFIIQACHFDFNLRRLERYLVMVHEAQIEPLLVLSKIDLVSADELQQLITKIHRAGIHVKIVALSNNTGIGFDEIRQELIPGKTYCLLGSSGVGKTTLINQLIGRNTLQTKTVSNTGEGRHTTVRRQIIILENGAMLIDTPGMRELGIAGATDGIDDSFTDIQDLSLACRFTNCSHTNEPGCAVLAAINDGTLNEEHFGNFVKLKKESQYYSMSYSEKRKKDKSLGKYYKTVLKDKKGHK